MSATSTRSVLLRRHRWRISGQVQGVGYRPFVYRLARRLGLSGYVCNEGSGVVVEVQGELRAVAGFARHLFTQAPPLARHERICAERLTALEDAGVFVIGESRAGGGCDASATVDTAVCGACLSELADTGDRRHGHGLINCTNCGPRYSIVRASPYDRCNTTMSDFAMCARCEAEYGDAGDRRFHAQPTCCHACGPQLSFAGADGRAIGGDPISIALGAAWLEAGRIVAVKGVGGYHLAVRADREEAVSRLRSRKARDAKPFALMTGSLEAAERLVRLSDAGRRALCSPASPIVLAARRSGSVETAGGAECGGVAASVAPGHHRLGVMLPNTPVQHLLFEAMRGRVDCLVMTSGNRSDEPTAYEDADAVARLRGLCDGMLGHDRAIARCVDDSVLLDVLGMAPLPVRRSRGYVPSPVSLPRGVREPGLCMGGELKNTIALVDGCRVIMSQHIGDLKHPLAYASFVRAIDDLRELFGIQPRWVAHDAHPQYLSSTYARTLASRWGVKLIDVQHHHAHAAAVLGEHACTGGGMALVCDGVGYSGDGTSWGGELLMVEGGRARRLATMRRLWLSGGDAAAVDARRCGAGLLLQCLGEDWSAHPAAVGLFDDEGELRMMGAMLRRRTMGVWSSAVGRVFDGAAALLGLRLRNRYEGEAAMAVESAAFEAAGPGERCGAVRLDEAAVTHRGDGVLEIDLSPTIRSLLAGRAAGAPTSGLAAAFHDALADAWAMVIARCVEAGAARRVGLSGGVFCNGRLVVQLRQRLEEAGIAVLCHRHVPANDGGLAYGQAAVAAAMGQAE